MTIEEAFEHPLTPSDIPVRTEVFLHDLPPLTLEALRRAAEQGLMPSGLHFGGDDSSIAIIRFARTPEVEREQRK